MLGKFENKNFLDIIYKYLEIIDFKEFSLINLLHFEFMKMYYFEFLLNPLCAVFLPRNLWVVSIRILKGVAG